MDALLFDLRQALRSLRGSPGFTVAAALTLALGIGANGAVFGLARGVLLRPLPFADPDRLVALWEARPESPQRPVAPANFLDWREAATGFSGLAAYRSLAANLLAPGEPERLAVGSVSRNFFQVLGIEARLGRTFSLDEPVSIGDRGAVISSDLWTRRFAAAADAIGAPLTLDDETVTVLGVAPAGLDLPADVDVWLPAPDDVPELGRGMIDSDLRQMRDAWYFAVVGRLAEGVPLRHAAAEMDAVAARLAAAHPSTNRDAGVLLVPLQEDVVGDTRSTLSLLAATVGTLLLIAAANVANLALARSTGRGGEAAVRAALGAGRGRLLRLSLIESLLVGALGGMAGTALSVVGLRFLVAAMPADTPRLDQVNIDWQVLAFAALVTLLASMLFGALPARQGSRIDLSQALRPAPGGGNRAAARGRDSLLAAQIAGALALVAGAGLLLRSLFLLQAVDPGISRDPGLMLRVNLPQAESMAPAERDEFFRAVVTELGLLPGVRAVGGALLEPLRVGPSAGARTRSRPLPDDELPDVYWNVVTPSWFAAAGVPLRRGRLLADVDGDGPPVAVINETAARLLFADADAIGEEIRTGLDGEDWVRVVGVVADTRNAGPGSATLPAMFRPLGQAMRWRVGHLHVLLRTDGDPLALARVAREAVWRVRADIPVDRVRPLADLLAAGTASPRQLSRILAMLAAVALALATVGTYAVVSCLVAGQAREIAVRMSLGAAPAQVVAAVLRRTLRTALAGVAGGIALAALLGGASRELRYGVGALDPPVLAVAAGLLVLGAMAAAIVPALRAARVAPMRILRQG